MSETVHYKGVLVPIKSNGDMEKDCESILTEYGFCKSNHHDDFKDAVEDELYKKVAIIGEQIFKVEMKEIDPYDDIILSSKNDDGSINFEVKYYNGGCSFNEAIEEALSDGEIGGEEVFLEIANGKREEFEKLSRPLIKFLCENFHPHATVIINTDSAELLNGVAAFRTGDYIPD
jgi:hypothetical protein